MTGADGESIAIASGLRSQLGHESRPSHSYAMLCSDVQLKDVET